MPNKRAVITGVSKYEPPSKKLEGAAPEAVEWAKLLTDKFGYAQKDVRTLIDGKANHGAVEADLKWLLDGAGRDDQLVFIHCGHGTEVPFKNGAQQALLMHHASGTAAAAQAAITESDISTLMRTKKPPVDADVTLILDCCFSGGLEVWPPALQGDVVRVADKVTWPMPKIAFTRLFDFPRGTVVSRFGAWNLEAGTARPLIVAACEDGKTAAQRADAVRMVFSSIAIELLRKNKAQSHEELVQTVERDPIAKAYDQRPCLDGNNGREANPFLN